MELRERVAMAMMNHRGISEVDRTGGMIAVFQRDADAAIAAVLDTMGDPSEGVRSIGQKCEAVGCDGGEIYKAMLAAFRTEALGESQDRDTIAP